MKEPLYVVKSLHPPTGRETESLPMPQAQASELCVASQERHPALAWWFEPVTETAGEKEENECGA